MKEVILDSKSAINSMRAELPESFLTAYDRRAGKEQQEFLKDTIIDLVEVDPTLCRKLDWAYAQDFRTTHEWLLCMK